MSRASPRQQLLQWICSAAVSHARTSLLLERVQGSLDRALRCGGSTLGSLASYDRATSALRTLQPSLFEEETRSLVLLPRSGTMRSGIVYQLRPSAPLTRETGSTWSRGQSPTPGATENGSSQNEGQVPHERPTAG